MAAQGKCTFGTRMPLNFNLLNEVVAREIKHYKVDKSFNPNFNRKPITCKFYATHDRYVPPTSDEHQGRVASFFHHLRHHKMRGPLFNYTSDVTENQRYGWYYQTDLGKMDRKDPRFYHPLKPTPVTKIRQTIMAGRNRTKD